MLPLCRSGFQAGLVCAGGWCGVGTMIEPSVVAVAFLQGKRRCEFRVQGIRVEGCGVQGYFELEAQNLGCLAGLGVQGFGV